MSALAASSRTNLPGVSVGGIPVGGLTREQTRAVIARRTDELLNRGFLFTAAGRTATLLSATLAPTDPDLVRERITFHYDLMVDEAYVPGHRGFFLSRLGAFFRSRRAGVALPLRFSLNEEALAADLRRAFSDLEHPKREPSFTVLQSNGSFDFSVAAGAEGAALAAEEAIAVLRRQIARGGSAPVAVPLVRTPTALAFESVEALIPEAIRALGGMHTTTTVTFGSKQWPVTRTAIAGWLSVEAGDDGAALAFDAERLGPFFDDLAPQVEVESRDAKFSVEGKRVVEFQASREGIAIDREATRRALEAAWLRSGGGFVELTVTKTPPKVAVGDLNSLGIKEILGVGTSNFSGSPRNRVKNIRNGITKLNGTLIEPGEEFSLLAALRPFTPEGGYLPELVIKGDKIIPELGGGLCQIGTTTFRMAMNAGMRITARQNHSLVVRYYNDPKNKNPGTDATIYDPSPDFKFVNDTANYLLFATEMNTATGVLTFTLWGTPDGRRGTYDAPVVTRWYPAGEDKEIPTTELKPGERKCQEKHPGADAAFTYTRTLPDGTEEKKLYTSHYRPLPRTCLVGVTADQLPAPGSQPAAGSGVPDAAAAADAGAPAI